MSKIKFVYFDVGGVVIKDFSETNKWGELLNEFNINDEYWDKYYGKIDVGEIPSDAPMDYSKLLEGFVSRFERNELIWPIIYDLKKKCKIGLLTNMYSGMLDSIKKHNLFPKINWDVIIDSSIEKAAKPDRKIFEIAQEKAGVTGDEILFVENSKKHIEAAKSFGWQTFWYDSANYQKSSLLLTECVKILV